MARDPARIAVIAALLAALWASGLAGAAPAQTQAPTEHGPTVLVFAAASLTDALNAVAQAFTSRTGVAVKASFAASSLLAKQIEAGAPADVFFSADHEWMDYLEQHRLLRGGSRRDLLANHLVLVAPSDSTLTLKIAPGFALAAALGNGRLATGDPDSVPVGRYAQAALVKLGVWGSVAGRLVRAENVRAALAYVARGEAPLGIVYQTDALAEKRVRIVDTFPDDSYPPIIYPVALTSGARPEGAQLADFLASTMAAEIFARYGFAPLVLGSGH